MPLPVIEDMYQAVLVWSNPNAPRNATNRLHFRDSVGTQTEADLYADLNTNVVAGMWTVLSLSATITSINITDLSASAAGVSFATGGGAKWTGAGTTDCILQGSAVVSLKSPLRGPRGRNRIYLPWVSEAQQSNGTLDSTNVTNMTAAWNTFRTNMQTAGWTLSAVSEQYNSWAAVTSNPVRPYLQTQRRRAR